MLLECYQCQLETLAEGVKWAELLNIFFFAALSALPQQQAAFWWLTVFVRPVQKLRKAQLPVQCLHLAYDFLECTCKRWASFGS